MIKIIFVNESRHVSFLSRVFGKLFTTRTELVSNGIEVLKVVKSEGPTLVFFDFEKPQSGEIDINNFLKDSVSKGIFEISIVGVNMRNVSLYKNLHIKLTSFFRNHFGPRGKSGGIKEAYVRR